MNMMRSATLLLAVLFVSGASAQSVTYPVFSGLGEAITAANASESIIVQALNAANLTATVAGASNITVLAPTDAAFAAVLKQLGMTPAELLADTETLAQVLTYHVVAKLYASPEDIAADGVVGTLANNMTLTVTEDMTELEITAVGSTAKFTTAGLNAHIKPENATAPTIAIYAIDTVLLPMVIEEEVTYPVFSGVIEAVTAANASGSILVQALTAANLTATVAGMSDITVLAPTDEAFVAALETTLGMTAEQLLADTTLLQSILAYHVVTKLYASPEAIAEDGLVLTLSPNQTLNVTESMDGTLVVIAEQSTAKFTSAGLNAHIKPENATAPTIAIYAIDSVLVPKFADPAASPPPMAAMSPPPATVQVNTTANTTTAARSGASSLAASFALSALAGAAAAALLL